MVILGLGLSLSAPAISQVYDEITGAYLGGDGRNISGTNWRVKPWFNNSANMYSFAQDNAPVVKRFSAGQIVTAISTGVTGNGTGSWIEVYQGASSGWMDTSELREIKGSGGNTGSSGGSAASGQTYTVTKVNEWASLRSSATASSTRIMRVYKGQAVKATGQSRQGGGLTWLKVRVDGETGWMPAKYLASKGRPVSGGGNSGSSGGSAASGQTYTVTKVNEWASLRSSATASSTRIMRVYKGQAVKATGQSRQGGGLTWLKVTVDGETGWMPTKYLASNGRSVSGGSSSSAGGSSSNAGMAAYRITNVNEWASLRASPSTSATRLKRVYKSEGVVSTGRQRQAGGLTWLEVDAGDETGWIPTKYLRKKTLSATRHNSTPATAPTPLSSGVDAGVMFIVTNVNEWASLRAAPSTQSARLLRLYKGEGVDTTGNKRQAQGLTWLQVKAGGFTGWMPTKYLRDSRRAASSNANSSSGSSSLMKGGWYRVINVNNWASLRPATNTNGRMAKVPKGDWVSSDGITRRAGGLTWLKVSYGDLFGWMPTKYLQYVPQ